MLTNPLVDYTYDLAGRRTKRAMNNFNQYTAIGADAPTHDANGNLSSTGGWSYSYDAQNRLVGASNLTTTAAFAYDGRNRCVTRTINGTTTHYYFDAWNIIEEHNASGLQLAATAHGEEEDEPIFRWDIAGNLSYYHQDALGNVTALTDTLGIVTEKYSYDIHGTPTISDALNQPRATSFFNNRFLFTGREYLCDLALYDYRNRVYSPALGRFLQTDPISFDGDDVNLYRYVFNDPVNTVDPSGLSGCKASAYSAYVAAVNAAKQRQDAVVSAAKATLNVALDAANSVYTAAKSACMRICDPGDREVCLTAAIQAKEAAAGVAEGIFASVKTIARTAKIAEITAAKIKRAVDENSCSTKIPSKKKK